MASAILMLSDEGPAISMHLSWEGAFDAQSPAHQHMLLLKKAMDQMAQAVPDSEPIPSAIGAAQFHAAIEAEERKALENGTAAPMFGTAAH